MSNKTQLQANNIELQEILEMAGNLQETKREFNPGEVTLDNKSGDTNYATISTGTKKVNIIKGEDYPTIDQYFVKYEDPLSTEELINGTSFEELEYTIEIKQYDSTIPGFQFRDKFIIDENGIYHGVMSYYSSSSSPNPSIIYMTSKDGILWEIKDWVFTDVENFVSELYIEKINDVVLISVYFYVSSSNKTNIIYKYDNGSLVEIFPKGNSTRFTGDEVGLLSFNDNFILVDTEENSIWYSSDGNTWNQSSDTPSYFLFANYFFVWNGKMFYKFSGTEYYYCTTPGGSWTEVTNVPWGSLNDVDMSPCGDYLVAIVNSSNNSEGQSGTMYYSTNGTSWTANNNFSYTRQLYQYCSYIDGYYIIKIYNYNEDKVYLYYSKTINSAFTSTGEITSSQLGDCQFLKAGNFIVASDNVTLRLIKANCPYLIMPRYTETAFVKL